MHRRPRTVAQDGFRGGINYDANDRFCLDSQRLMMISGAYYGAPGAEYRTEVDSFLKITSLGTAGSGPASFIVKTKGGEGTMGFHYSLRREAGVTVTPGSYGVEVEWVVLGFGLIR